MEEKQNEQENANGKHRKAGQLILAVQTTQREFVMLKWAMLARRQRQRQPKVAQSNFS